MNVRSAQRTTVLKQRWNLLTEAEKKEGLHLTHRSFSQHVAQAVDCVGCRQSLEALVSKMYAAEVPVPEVRNVRMRAPRIYLFACMSRSQ